MSITRITLFLFTILVGWSVAFLTVQSLTPRQGHPTHTTPEPEYDDDGFLVGVYYCPECGHYEDPA